MIIQFSALGVQLVPEVYNCAVGAYDPFFSLERSTWYRLFTGNLDVAFRWQMIPFLLAGLLKSSNGYLGAII